TVTFIVVYETVNPIIDFIDNPNGPGALAVFHWAPTQWAQEIPVESVRVIFPIIVGPEDTIDQAFFDRYGILTEESLTTTYDEVIWSDNYVNPSNGLHYLNVNMVKYNAPPYFHFEFSFYTNPNVFSDVSMYYVLILMAVSIGLGLIIVSIFLVYRDDKIVRVKRKKIIKENSIKTPKKLLISIINKSYMYEKPKIKLETLGIPGNIIKDLDPIEAAFFLDLPVVKILNLIIMDLYRRGVIEILDKDPIILRLYLYNLKEPPYYETKLLNSLLDGKKITKESIESVIKVLAENIQIKVIDADFEKTAEFYRSKIQDIWNSIENESDNIERANRYWNKFDENGNWLWLWLYIDEEHDEKLKNLELKGVRPPFWLMDFIKNLKQIDPELKEKLEKERYEEYDELTYRYALQSVEKIWYPFYYSRSYTAYSASPVHFSPSACHSACHNACFRRSLI
ncbi:MAG: hypothetical protein ACTSPQ_00950, partial [Candidatus Helarchaeota archaeon]